MFNPTQDFRQAILSAGLEPPQELEPGRIYRFPGVNKRNGNTAGWCILFEDGLGGCFGDWSIGLSENWQTQCQKPFSSEDNVIFNNRVKAARLLAEKDREQGYKESAERALAIWESAKQVTDTHPYLACKQVPGYGIRQHTNELVIPIRNGNVLQSLQFISEDGSKRFLKGGKVAGGYHGIGSVTDAECLCIAEGFATGATIHKATGYPVAVSFNASNLELVALAMREKFPALPIILCADDDVETKGNPGLVKAHEAARAVEGKVAVPKFGSERPAGLSDFNDMSKTQGIVEVKNAIMEALNSGKDVPEDWPEPLPIITEIDPVPYPLDALPEIVRAAVDEVQAFTKAPIALVASTALAALSLAIQAYVDVERAPKLAGPSGLFLLTVADSGERKSTCDSFFLKPIREYEARQIEDAKPLIKDYKAELEAWKSKISGLKAEIRKLSKSGEPTKDKEEALIILNRQEPKHPRVPRLIYSDATPEALKWNLAKTWPSGGIISSEAGLIFGGHGMNSESAMRNLATLNQLWDGADIATERRSSESFTVRGARLTVALQIQEPTLRSFFDRVGDLARGTGFLARFLLACPESTQGYRPFSDPPDAWPALSKFHEVITEILQEEVVIGKNGGLTPFVITLDEEAKPAWKAFHDAIETELGPGRDLADVRDVASKTADNAARIAALFQVFNYPSTKKIGIDVFEAASRIAAWHLHEARRFFTHMIMPQEQTEVIQLNKWLIDYCRKQKSNIILRREIQRNITPAHLRKPQRLERALKELIEANRVMILTKDKRKEIHVNPHLLVGGQV